MPFVVVLNTVMVEMRMQLDGQRVENTLYFHRDSGWELEDALSLGADLVTWWGTNYAARLTANLSLTEVFITDLSDPNSFGVSVLPEEATVGGSGLDYLPNNVAMCISFRTAGRGRSNRGRNYIPGIVRSDVVNNQIGSDWTEDLVGAYEELFTVATSHDATWNVVSRFSGVDPDTGKPIPRTTGITTPVTTPIFVDNFVDSQRRRLPGRGQ